MFSEEVLEKIFSNPETIKIPFEYQSAMIHIIEQALEELEDKYARLKMARLIDMADDDELKSTRKRINKMIASVDKCLATRTAQ